LRSSNSGSPMLVVKFKKTRYTCRENLRRVNTASSVILSRLLSSMNSRAGKRENNLESYPFVKLDSPPNFKVFKYKNIGFFLMEDVPFAIAEIPLSSMCLLPVKISCSNFRQSPIFSMTFFPISSCVQVMF